MQITCSFITYFLAALIHVRHKLHKLFTGEWMVWNSLILVALPSTISSLSSGLDLVLLAGLLSISYIMSA